MKRTFLFLLVFFSVFSSCKHQQEEDLNLKHLNYIASSISSDLTELKNDLLSLTEIVQYRVPFDRKVTDRLPQKYYYKNGKALFCDYQKSGSAIYLPADKKITNQLKNTIVNSEILDSLFRNSIKKNPLLSQVYFLDTNSFLRIYPYVDVLSYVKNPIDLTKLITYKTAAYKPFQDDNAYWVSRPFADPYGRGWVFSCVQPLYFRDNFIGIISGDITLRSLKEKFFSSDTEMVLMTDASGKLICCTKEAAKIADIPLLREFQYFKPVNDDIFTFSNPSLTHHKNKDFRDAIKSLLTGKNKESYFMENKKYTIYKSYIKETNWILFKIVN